MAVIEISQIQIRRGQENQTGIPQLSPGEFGWAEDTENLYIGKRIVEGANNDENTRILTEKDYNNFFALFIGTNTSVASTATYRYRNEIPYDEFRSTTTTIAKKLDINISLVDYMDLLWTPSFIGTDITVPLSNAITDIFDNSMLGTDTRRKLILPAGVYTVSPTEVNQIYLPSYATIVGEGAGLTTLILGNTATSIFQTITTGTEGISLQGMTLAYSTNTFISTPLLTLDTTSKVSIKDITFNSQISSNASSGIGVYLKGGFYTPNTEHCKNITIEDCVFENIAIGIASTGSVTGIKIDNNVFEGLQQGINLSADPADASRQAPRNAIISRNTFKDVITEGIFVGTSTSRANHVSENNIFMRVGNGVGLQDFVSTSSGTTAVIAFYGDGCRSISDSFSRRDYAYSRTELPGQFYYNPIMVGKGTIHGGGIYTATISSNPSTLDLFYVSNKNQLLTIPYSLYDQNNNYSRTGNLTVNITASSDGVDGYGSVSDYYNYSYTDLWEGASGETTGDGTVHPAISMGASTNNYVPFVCTTNLTSTTYYIEYQINSLS